MKREFLLGVICIMLANMLNGQDTFENGFIEYKDGRKIEALIKNEDWKNNPKTFVYKQNETSDEETGDLSQVESFGIGSKVKFRNAKVQVDQSSNDINYLSKTRRPEFEEDHVFLEVVIEGKASLFRYEKDRITRYFFSVDNDVITPLVYKRYKTSGSNIGVNNQFRSQLQARVTNEYTSERLLEITKYQSRSLIKYFSTYNGPENSSAVSYSRRTEMKNPVSLRVKVGANFQAMKVDTGPISSSLTGTFSIFADYGTQINPRFALEVEFIIPYTSNKWAAFIETTYQKYEKTVLAEAFVPQNSTAKLSSVDLSFGGRRYFPLNDNSKIWIDAFLAGGVIDNSELLFDSYPDIERTFGVNFGVGTGFMYRDKYLMEIRHALPRNPYTLRAKYTSTSLSLGYVIFQ